MGKSGAAKKKKAVAVSTNKNTTDEDNVTFLDRARELKEEGNLLFKTNLYPEAYEKYGQALKLAPEGHEDRAVLHSNRAACMLLMRPVPYEDVIKECTTALELKPKFARALLRRAKANEALANYRVALDDVETILESEANNEDAKEAQRRLVSRLKSVNAAAAAQAARGVANPAASTSAARAQRAVAPSAAATAGPHAAASSGNGPSMVNDSVKSGPSLSSRQPPPTPKGVPGLGLETKAKPKATAGRAGDSTEGNGVQKPQANGVHENGMSSSDESNPHERASRLVPAGPEDSSGSPGTTASAPDGAAKESQVSTVAGEVKATKKAKREKKTKKPPIPLKLVYDRGNDLRKAEMPRDCGPWGLREIVRKRFPSSKAVLIKYEDEEGDRVTITDREEFEAGIAGYLKQWEAAAATPPQTEAGQTNQGEKAAEAAQNGMHTSAIKQQAALKLYIVEVNPDQEPTFPEEEPPAEEVETEVEAPGSNDALVVTQDGEKEKSKGAATGDKDAATGDEIEIDDWVIDFANLFRHHLGIDPDSHVDIHELGMELCQQAMDETVSCPDAMPLFEAAAMKFEEVVALAYHNWGNVHTCIAKKHLNDDPHAHVHGRKEGEEPQVRKRPPEAYEKAKQHFSIAAQKYQEALAIKAEFSDAIVGWGQLLFENAKLELERTVQDAGEDAEHWEKLDFSEAVQLFGEAEAKMIAAERAIEETERMMLLKQKEQEQAEQGARAMSDRVAAEGAPDPASLLTRFEDYRRQVLLCHGNILFEHSIVDYRVEGALWDILLSKAITKFLAAGAAKDDVVNALKNHPASVKNVLQLNAKGMLLVLPNQATSTETVAVPSPQPLKITIAPIDDDEEQEEMTDNADEVNETTISETSFEAAKCEVTTESEEPASETAKGDVTVEATEPMIAANGERTEELPADDVPALIPGESVEQKRMSSAPPSNEGLKDRDGSEEHAARKEAVSIVNGRGEKVKPDAVEVQPVADVDKKEEKVNGGGNAAGKRTKKAGKKKTGKTATAPA